jgi:RimJ/RimL family protein N-acetyltransferase/uncharacterized damage-inducible protein DinB
MLRTRRLRLIPGTPDLLRADIAGPEHLAAALGNPVPSSWPPEYYDKPAMEWTLKHLEKDPANADWALFYVVGPDNRLVGVVGYKHPPDPDGMVEIGYGVVPEYQRQGIAAEAAGGLIDRAFGVPQVQRVIAETLPPLVSSIRVMEKNGLRLVGEGSEPGVIRFELTRADYEAGRRDIPDHLRHFLRMLGHQSWADARAITALERAESAPPTALTLLAHILGAEHIWLTRLKGVAPTQAVWPDLTIAQCRQLAAENELGYRELIFGLSPASMRRIVEYRNSTGQELQTAVEDILMQVFLHGSYHRGQVAMQLRLAEAVPEGTDYIAFARGTPAAVRQPK